MKKIVIIICITAIISVLITIAVMQGIRLSSPSYLPQSSSSSPITFTGFDSYNTTTSIFEITTEECIIEWSYISEIEELSEYTAFELRIYPEGKMGLTDFAAALLLVGDRPGMIHTYIEPGDYYIQTKCINIESWEIIIKPV